MQVHTIAGVRSGQGSPKQSAVAARSSPSSRGSQLGAASPFGPSQRNRQTLTPAIVDVQWSTTNASDMETWGPAQRGSSFEAFASNAPGTFGRAVATATAPSSLTCNPPGNGVQYTTHEMVLELLRIPESQKGARKAAVNFWIVKGWVPCSVGHCFKLARRYRDKGAVR